MEQLITVIVSTLCGIVTALGSVVIAYLHKKTKQLERDKKDLRGEINNLHNGFRANIYKKLENIEIRLEALEGLVVLTEKVKELKTDMKLVKGLVVENKKHYKEIEGKK